MTTVDLGDTVVFRPYRGACSDLDEYLGSLLVFEWETPAQCYHETVHRSMRYVADKPLRSRQKREFVEMVVQWVVSKQTDRELREAIEQLALGVGDLIEMLFSTALGSVTFTPPRFWQRLFRCVCRTGMAWQRTRHGERW